MWWYSLMIRSSSWLISAWKPKLSLSLDIFEEAKVEGGIAWKVGVDVKRWTEEGDEGRVFVLLQAFHSRMFDPFST